MHQLPIILAGTRLYQFIFEKEYFFFYHKYLRYLIKIVVFFGVEKFNDRMRGCLILREAFGIPYIRWTIRTLFFFPGEIEDATVEGKEESHLLADDVAHADEADDLPL